MKTKAKGLIKLSQNIHKTREITKLEQLEGQDYEQTRRHELDLTRRLAAELQQHATLRPDEIAEIRRNLLE